MKFFQDLVEIITTAEYRNYIFEGFLNTLGITFIAVVIGLVLGFLVAIIKPADLRDADGFCYRLIRTILSENLLHFGCKYNDFL